MNETIKFTFSGKKLTAYLKPDEKYDIYLDGILVAMAVREDFIKLLL